MVQSRDQSNEAKAHIQRKQIIANSPQVLQQKSRMAMIASSAHTQQQMKAVDQIQKQALQRMTSTPTTDQTTQLKQNGVVQKVIDTSTDGMTEIVGEPEVKGFAGLPVASKTVTAMQPTSDPADPPNMAFWKEKGYLKDPATSRNQALTRMHAIRGQFGGPSAANNMFLGTAKSNNFSDASHFRLVERPLQNFIEGAAKGQRGFHYTVSPNFGAIPGYMSARIESVVESGDKASFGAFASAHIPNGFTCNASLYANNAGKWYAKNVSEPVATDVGAVDASIKPASEYAGDEVD